MIVPPSRSREVCLAVEPMSYRSGMLIVCDRKPRHTGKHMCRFARGGRMDWWKTATVDEDGAIYAAEHWR